MVYERGGSGRGVGSPVGIETCRSQWCRHYHLVWRVPALFDFPALLVYLLDFLSCLPIPRCAICFAAFSSPLLVLFTPSCCSFFPWLHRAGSRCGVLSPISAARDGFFPWWPFLECHELTVGGILCSVSIQLLPGCLCCCDQLPLFGDDQERIWKWMSLFVLSSRCYSTEWMLLWTRGRREVSGPEKEGAGMKSSQQQWGSGGEKRVSSATISWLVRVGRGKGGWDE